MAIVRRLLMQLLRYFGIPADSVLVASTGVIGMQIPIDRIVNGVKAMARSLTVL